MLPFYVIYISVDGVGSARLPSAAFHVFMWLCINVLHIGSEFVAVIRFQAQQVVSREGGALRSEV